MISVDICKWRILMRLSPRIADGGAASRRRGKQSIPSGRVAVDGVVAKVGTQFRPDTDERNDDRPLPARH